MFQNEKVIETKICKHCFCKFDITDKDLEFYEKVSPVFNSPSPSDIPLKGGGTKGGVIKLENGKIKYLIPSPTLCPQCREQRRFSWRNERNLYRRKCDFSGRDIISIYSPDKPYKVYDQNIWWSDKWNALDYGCDFDFSKSFFEQFEKILKNVPHISRMATNDIENSDYSNGVSNLKNCYLCFNSDYLEDSYYSYTCIKSKNIIDCYMLTECENCYRCCNCYHSYNLKYSKNSDTCAKSTFLDNCINCKNCFCCNNLRNKEYYAFNKKYNKEEYEKIVSETLNDFDMEEIYSKSITFSQKFPKKYYFGKNNENFSGDYIYNSKNVENCYNVDDVENCKNCFYIFTNTKDCQDFDIYGDGSSLIYESIMTGSNIYKSAFNIGNWGDCSNMYYCFLCVNSCKNCFGCVGLKNKEYCILNKQYSKEEYEKLVPKIIGHMSSLHSSRKLEWGEFFPTYLCPFDYNETVANDFYPLEKEKVENLGFNWKEEKNNQKKGEEKIYIPLPINNYSDKYVSQETANENKSKLLNSILKCKISGKFFRITRQELDFYIKNMIPIPTKHFDIRYQELLGQRNMFKLYKKKCDKCGKNIQTTYALERPEIVYCEECYEKEIY